MDGILATEARVPNAGRDHSGPVVPGVAFFDFPYGIFSNVALFQRLFLLPTMFKVTSLLPYLIDRTLPRTA